MPFSGSMGRSQDDPHWSCRFQQVDCYPASIGRSITSFAQVKQGGVYQGKQLIEMPEEIHFLKFLGFGDVNPKTRRVGLPFGTGGDINDARKPQRIAESSMPTVFCTRTLFYPS
jgi:hypothetical protein